MTALCILSAIVFLFVFVVAPCIVAGRCAAAERARGLNDGR